MPADDLFTRDEVVTGLPAKRASTLLFLIENRTAQLKAKSRRAMERFLTEEAAKERDLAYLQAFSAGKPPPQKPGIQDLERFAAQWADLVPDNPQIRAATVHSIAQKYTFTQKSIPGVKAALGMDNQIVQETYQRLFNEPLSSIYATQTGFWDQIHWSWVSFSRRLESLSPFWTAFSLTLTETVGAGILALPIAFANIGPLPAVFLLVLLGLINVITVAAMAEAACRSANIRYGNAYFGRMVSDYLGQTGSIILSISLAILMILTLLAYYFGFSTTLADATHIPAGFWAAVLFIVCIYFVRQESLNATIASALVVGAINIGFILILSALSIGHIKSTNLMYFGALFLQHQPFTPSILGSIFGVVLVAYFGHTSVGNCAKVVLQRDPTGRTLVWGCMAGQLAAIAIYTIWVIAVNGAVAPQQLSNQPGTALIPLAGLIGPVIKIIGSLYVLLAIGMASIHFSLGLYNLLRERLSKAGTPQTILSDNRQKWILLSPIVGVFLISELFIVLKYESFTQPLGFVGVIVMSLLGGIFPILLLISSRKKGEILPGYSLSVFNFPGIKTGIYLLFLANLFMHGLLIWRNSLQGVVALLVGVAAIALTILLRHKGAFSPRVLLEFRSNRAVNGKVSYSITSEGAPLAANVQLRYPEREESLQAYQGDIFKTSLLQCAVFQIPPSAAWDLKVLAFQFGPGSLIETLPAQLDIHVKDHREQYDLSHSDGEAQTLLRGESCKIVFSFAHKQGGLIYADL